MQPPGSVPQSPAGRSAAAPPPLRSVSTPHSSCSACVPFKCCHALHALQNMCGSIGHAAAFSQCSLSAGHQMPSAALRRAGNGAGGGSPAAAGLRRIQRPRVGGRVTLRQRQRLWQLHGRPAPTQQRLWRRRRPLRGIRRNGLRVCRPSHRCVPTCCGMPRANIRRSPCQLGMVSGSGWMEPLHHSLNWLTGQRADMPVAGFDAGAPASDYVKVPPRPTMPRTPPRPTPVFRSLVGDGKAAPKRRLSTFGTPGVEQPAAPQVGAKEPQSRSRQLRQRLFHGYKRLRRSHQVTCSCTQPFLSGCSYCTTRAHVRYRIPGGAGPAMHVESDAAAVMQAKLAPPPPPSSSSQAADLLRAARPPPAASVDPFATMGQDGELHTRSMLPAASCCTIQPGL